MTQLKIALGQYSDKGKKEINQDFHGAYIPKEPLLNSKGIAIAIADGISSSEVSQIASQFAVTGFLEDYYSTSEAWSVKTSAERVLAATNSWLHSQTQNSQYRYDKDRGYVCTFSAMVIKSMTAHLFHVGDTRIYQLHGNSLEQLTNDHRVTVSREETYLGRALGITPQIEIDYRTLQVESGDVFLLATDGVYERTDASFIASIINKNKNDLDLAAKTIVEESYNQGSEDNLTLQIIRIEELPNPEANEIHKQLSTLPFPPPLLEPRMEFDGYKILRELHASSRSHIYLAQDIETDTVVIIKIPSTDMRENPEHLERFLMEEWVARRINNAHVLKPCMHTRKRNYIYVVSEYIEGQTLKQWMIDNPQPKIEAVRNTIEQLAKGIRALHRLEMLHQDLKPDNIMIDTTGTVKIIDFGSTRVAGIMETTSLIEQNNLLGEAQYAAPEYFLGESGTQQSDIFSLGVIVYQMLTGRLPYGAQVPRTTTKTSQSKLSYVSVLNYNKNVPSWVDETIKKAVHPNPYKRYADVFEFVYDLHNPNKEFLNKKHVPLIERDPVIFWKTISCILFLIIVALLIKTH